jgi:hypothetical protein
MSMINRYDDTEEELNRVIKYHRIQTCLLINRTQRLTQSNVDNLKKHILIHDIFDILYKKKHKYPI